MTILIILASVLCFIIIYHLLTRKYINPYKLIMIFGAKGCGKSTYLMKLALKYQRQGVVVYSTEPIPGTYHIDPGDVGYCELDPGSVLLIDEVSLLWHSRDFKTFPKEIREWFKLQRHRKVAVYMVSQSYDVDKSLRDLCDQLYLLERRFRVFSYGKRISKNWVLNNSTAEAPSNIAENMVFDPLLLFWAGSRMFTFIPKYAKYFDSFDCKPLRKKSYKLIPYPDRLQPKWFPGQNFEALNTPCYFGRGTGDVSPVSSLIQDQLKKSQQDS